MSDVINRITSRIKTAIGKALIEAVSDDNQLQLVKISGLADDVQSDVERIQDYGITSNPPVGSESVVLYINGGKDHGVVIKTDSSEFRIQGLESGEVCIYSKFGQKILLDKNGDTVFNDGSDFLAGFTDLKTGFDTMRTELNAAIAVVNAHIHSGVLAGPVTSGPLVTPAIPAVATIDAAKVEELKIP